MKNTAPFNIQQAIRERERRDRAVSGWRTAGFPPRHLKSLGVTRDTPGPWQTLFRRILDRLEQGDGGMFVLLGNRGVGKTQLATDVAHVEAHGTRAATTLYRTAGEMVAEAVASMSVDGGGLAAHSLKLARVNFLVIDEWQVRKRGEFDDRLLTDVIDRRYRDLRTTLIVSNETRDEFASGAGESVVSRAVETGGIVECAWTSFRTPRGGSR